MILQALLEVIKMINVAILGYGNLGKAAEKLALNQKDMHLVGIFSRRKVSSPFSTNCYAVSKLNSFAGRIDVVLMCGGSACDIPKQAPVVLKNFCLVNCYDTHSQIESEKQKLSNIAKKSKKTAIIAAGWDPGLFSIIRTYCMALFGNEPQTYWGDGISMGHSDALRRVKGVDDAAAITIPNKKHIKSQKGYSHKRRLFIVKKPSALKQEIVCQIKQNKQYFSNCNLKIKFVSKKYFDKHLKGKNYHKGMVLCGQSCEQNTSHFKASLSMSSNAYLTAQIMLAYCRAAANLFEKHNYDCFLPTDVAPCHLFSKGDIQINALI